jgi:glutamate-1-semialdehyde 2,1-aminomutase
MTHRIATPPLMDLVPGGCHTYSKGPDQFPSNAPAAIVKGQGARVLGDDDRWYVEWGMGLTAVSLGHGHPEVCAAAAAANADGTNFIRPSTLEAAAAARFLDTFGGDMVKFCKNGSVATTAAVKLARGFTGRRKIALPYEHPFFSYDDWFIGTTDADLGIPEDQKALSLRFHYNDLASLEAIFAEHGPDMAGVILEPVKFDAPEPGFLEGIRALCDRYGAVFILDETIAGLKWTMRGGQGYFKVAPDLSVWGKGLANGFSACALSGRRDIMSIGGSNQTGRKLFLVSTTHGAESGGLAAMMATIDIFQRSDVIGDNWRRGARLKDEMLASVRRHALDRHLVVKGYPCLLLFTFTDIPEARGLEWKTLIMQEMARHGVLSQGVLYPTLSHDDAIVDETVAAFDAALVRVAEAWATGSTRGFLEGPAIKPVFRKFQECVKSRCGRVYPGEAKEACC